MSEVEWKLAGCMRESMDCSQLQLRGFPSSSSLRIPRVQAGEEII